MEKWYDWHRGYKDITLEDGTSERQHLEGERLEDTAPGCLPRTTEEIRSGQVSEPSAGILSPPSLRNDPNAQNIYIPTTQHHDDDIDPEDSIFDGLPAPPLPVNPSGPLAAASTARPNNIRRSAHRLASLRRELQHMRLGIDRIMSNIQGTETSLPDSEEAVNTTIRLENRLNTLQAQLTQTNHSRQLVQDVAVNRAQENGDGDHTQAHRERLMASERYRDDFRHLRDHAQDLVRDLEVQHEQACRTAYQHRLDLNDYRRSLTVFGTPAEAQQPDYESPVGGMFNRATEGYQIAEAQRVQHNQPQEARSRSVIAQLLETDRAMQANGIVPHPSQQAEPSTNEATQGHEINQVQGGHPIVGTVLSASERLTDFTSGGRALNDLDAQAAANVGLEALAAWRVGGSTNNVDTTPVAPATSSTPPNFAPVANMGQNMGPRPLVVHPAGYALRDLIRTAALDFPRAFDFPESDVLLAEARNSLQSPANQIPNHQLTAVRSTDHSNRNVTNMTVTKPAPIDEEAKKVSMECKICFEQLSTVAVLPCGKFLAIPFAIR